MKKILYALSTSIFILSCSSYKLTTEITIQQLETPPGTKKIADNLYIDEREIRNIDYLEFLNWNKRIYGINSIEYTSIYPDTTLWSRLNISYTSLDSNYLHHPYFKQFSVLGVSNKQAKEFTKWRSDRVMEFILIQQGIIKFKPTVSKDSIFTIEKYFSGLYQNRKPNPYLTFYPEYKLLDTIENTISGFKNICVYKKWK